MSGDHKGKVLVKSFLLTSWFHNLKKALRTLSLAGFLIAKIHGFTNVKSLCQRAQMIIGITSYICLSSQNPDVSKVSQPFQSWSHISTAGDHIIKQERKDSEILCNKLWPDWLTRFTTAVNITKDMPSTSRV